MTRHPHHWSIRLTSVIGAPKVIILDTRNGLTDYDIIGVPTGPVDPVIGGVVKARNVAERYLEKLAADIARESVKR